MATKKYICVNLANCDLALAKTIQEVPDGEELECSECHRLLEPYKDVPSGLSKRMKWIAAAAAVVVLVIVLLCLVLPTSTPTGPTPKGSTPGDGGCALTPTKDVDVARMLQYVKQGMNYAAMNNSGAALAEFRQGLAIDGNFPGLRLNEGAALLALKQPELYGDAEAALKKELELVGCLEPMPDGELQGYAYMMEIAEKGDTPRETAQAQTLRARLGRLRALAQYNLACLYSLKRDEEPALKALEAAIDAGFDDKGALAADPDLAFVRDTQKFKALILLKKLD